MEMHTYESLRRVHGIDPGPARSGAAIIRDLASIAHKRIIEPIRRELRNRRAIAQLHALDDRLLKDIGLHRSQIETAVTTGFANDRRSAS